MSNYKNILEKLYSHKIKIEHSWMLYRTKAKKQKITVLSAAAKYLSSEISRHQFMKILATNENYADAFFKSKTERMIEIALKETPQKNITYEGYIKMRRG